MREVMVDVPHPIEREPRKFPDDLGSEGIPRIDFAIALRRDRIEGKGRFIRQVIEGVRDLVDLMKRNPRFL